MLESSVMQAMRLDSLDQLIIGKVSNAHEIYFAELRREIPEISDSTLLYRVKNLLMDGKLDGMKQGRRLVLRPAA